MTLTGYVCMGRSFAYWGIPPWHVFVGEVVLACFLFCGPLSGESRWPWAALKYRGLQRFCRWQLILLAFGGLQVFHGVLAGYPPLTALRDLAFDYYPLYFFVGAWVASQNMKFLAVVLKFLAWTNGLYGLAYILVLNRFAWFYPGLSHEIDPVRIFGQPLFSGAILLGILSLNKDLRGQWLPLVLNMAVLLGMVTRGEWLAFGVGLVVWAGLTKNFKKLAMSGLAALVLLVMLYVSGLSIDAPEGRGGTISATDLVGRLIAPVNEDLASQYSSDAQMHEETVAFRTLWWLAIWDSVHQSASRALFGYGYGYALGDLVPYLEGDFIRTPHNVFFYALGYTGWIGVAIFGFLLTEIARLVWAAYRRTGQPFGLVFLVVTLTCALFTAFFETPYGAIPFYIITGAACAPLLHAKTQNLPVPAPLRGHGHVLKPLPDAAG